MRKSNLLRRRLLRGATLPEAVFGSVLSTMVVVGSVGVLLIGLRNWAVGQGMIDSDGTSQRGMRMVSSSLREAMSITVDPGGTRLDFRMPVRDAQGNFAMPITWDGVNRRFELSGSTLMLHEGSQSRPVVRNLVKQNGPAPWSHAENRIFTAGAGAITRSVTVKFVTSNFADKNRQVRSTSRETLFVRNVPELIR